jgi:hypothetical protein
MIRRELLTKAGAAALWEDFVAAHGEKVISGAYRMSRGFPVHGERVWHFLDARGVVVGWGSLIEDPMSWNLVYRLGVFPHASGEGVRERIHWALADEAFSDPNVNYMSGAVLLSNPCGQIDRIRRAAESGQWGQVIGMQWTPAPGMLLFTVSRDFYDRKRPDRPDDLLPEVGG